MFDNLTPDEVANLHLALTGAIAGAFLLLTVLAIAAFRRALRYASTLTGIAVNEDMARSADAAITTAMRTAEERFRQFAMGLIHEGPKTGPEKREFAKQVARSLAPQALAHVGDAQLEAMVDAKVQAERVGSLWPPRASAAPGPLGTTYQASIPPPARLPTYTAAPATPIPARRRTD